MFLENVYSKIQKFTVKGNSHNTDWIVPDPFAQVKSAEHMAKIITLKLSVSDRAHFPILLENSIKIYKTSVYEITITYFL